MCVLVTDAFARRAGTADSSRIICLLAHLCQTQETHRHSTENSPSFLTGLETKKREKGRGREFKGKDCSFTFRSWQTLYYNLAVMMEVFGFITVFLSVFLRLGLCEYQTRCYFEEERGGCNALVCFYMKGIHSVWLTYRCMLPLHGSLLSLIHELFFFFFYQQSTPPSGVCIEQISGCCKEWKVMRETLHQQLFTCALDLPWDCQKREDQYQGFGYESNTS